MAKQIQSKKYVVIDHENDDAFIYYGTLEEIHTNLENEWIDKMDHDFDTDRFINSLTVYELNSKPTKLKYTRAKLEIK